MRAQRAYQRSREQTHCLNLGKPTGLMRAANFAPLPLYSGEKNLWYPLNTRLGGPRIRSELFSENEKAVAPTANRLPDRQASSMVTISTELLKVNSHHTILELFLKDAYLEVCDLRKIKLQPQARESPVVSGTSGAYCGSQDMPLAAIGAVWMSSRKLQGNCITAIKRNIDIPGESPAATK